MELAGQVAIVTGGGRNIGRAIARELANMGADVVVAEIDGTSGAQTADEVRRVGRRAVSVQTDVRGPPTCAPWWTRRWGSSGGSTSS